jgi:hypothetical protein
VSESPTGIQPGRVEVRDLSSSHSLFNAETPVAGLSGPMSRIKSNSRWECKTQSAQVPVVHKSKGTGCHNRTDQHARLRAHRCQLHTPQVPDAITAALHDRHPNGSFFRHKRPMWNTSIVTCTCTYLVADEHSNIHLFTECSLLSQN